MLSFFYIRSLFDLMIVLLYSLHEINWFIDNLPICRMNEQRNYSRSKLYQDVI